jgi:hypothetical protein
MASAEEVRGMSAEDLSNAVVREHEIPGVLSALSDSSIKAVALIGPGAAGKTMIARMVLDRIGKEQPPPFSTLAAYRAHGLARTELQNLSGSLLLIDGIDEARSDDEQTIQTIFRRYVHGDFRTGKLLITSRYLPTWWEEGTNNTAVVYVGPLSLRESHDLVQRVLTSLGAKTLPASQFVDLMKESKGNPLILRLLAEQVIRAGKPDDEFLNDRLAMELATAPSLSSDVLQTLALFARPVSARELHTLISDASQSEVDRTLRRLVTRGVLLAGDDLFYFAHVGLREYAQQHARRLPAEESGTLYITFDPKVIPKEEILELLATLNALYASLGGDELIVKDDEVGAFSSAAVAV